MNKGPMNLQMGAMTAAVEDFIGGYETMVEKAPRLAENMGEMINHMGTLYSIGEEKAEEIRSLYEHIEGLTAGYPQLHNKAVSSYKKSLHDSVVLNDEIAYRPSETIQQIKSDLMAMEQERVVINVLTQDLVYEIKQGKQKAINAYNRDVKSKSYLRNQATTSTVRTEKNNTGIQSKVTEPSIYEPIAIPQFVPSGLVSSGKHVSSSKDPTSHSSTPTIQHNPKVEVRRALGERLPSFATGPSVDRDLNDVTNVMVGDNLLAPNHAYRRKVKRSNRQEPLVKVLMSEYKETKKQVSTLRDEFSEVVNKYGHDNDRKLRKMTTAVANLEKKHKAHSEQLINSVGRVIKEAVDTFQEAVQDTDAFRMLRGLRDEADAKNSELELARQEELQRLQLESEIYAQAVIMQREHAEYVRQQQELLNLQQRNEIAHPYPNVPHRIPTQVISPSMQNAATPQHEKYKVMSVTPHKEPLAPPVQKKTPAVLPDEPPVPSLETATVAEPTQVVPPQPQQQPIFNHVINVQPSSYVGVERELLVLLQSVVESNQNTFQGQQELVLRLIEQQQQQTQPPTVGECSTSTDDLVITPTTTPVVEEVAESVVEEKQAVTEDESPGSKPSYVSSLGEVLLEGASLQRPYDIEPCKTVRVDNFRDSTVHMKMIFDSNRPSDPPRLRPVASAALLQRLNEIGRDTVTEPPIENNVNGDNLSAMAILQQLVLANNRPVSTTATAMNSESIARAVQDGVQRGVQLALGNNHVNETMHRRTPAAEIVRARDSRITSDTVVARRHPPPVADPIDEDAIARDIAQSQYRVQSLADQDYSFGDSMSLGPDEQTEAWLGADRVNRLRDNSCRQQIVSDSDDHSDFSSDADEPVHATLYRSKATRDCAELIHRDAMPRKVSSTDGAENWYHSDDDEDEGGEEEESHVRDDSHSIAPAILALKPRNTERYNANNAKLQPLVSRVLRQSSTEAVLRNPALSSMFSNVACGGGASTSICKSYNNDSDGSKSDDENVYVQQSEKRLYKSKLHVQREDEKDFPSNDAVFTSIDQTSDSEGAQSPEDELTDMVRRQTHYSSVNLAPQSSLRVVDLPRQPRESNQRQEHDVQDQSYRRDDFKESAGSSNLLVNPHHVVSEMASRGNSDSKSKASSPASKIPRYQKSEQRSHNRHVDVTGSYDEEDSSVWSKQSSSGMSPTSVSSVDTDQSVTITGTVKHQHQHKQNPNSLADKLMVDLLRRQRVAAKDQKGSYRSNTRSSVSQDRDRHSNTNEFVYSPRGRDSDADLSFASNSTASSIASYVRAPSKLLTVRSMGTKQKVWR